MLLIKNIRINERLVIRMFKRQGFVLMLMLISIAAPAQLKINFSGDRPVNKLKMAEAAI